MARFHFRRSVGQNLRDLFAHDRLAAQANNLGYSSLSPGEGSFDILDAAGNAVARYGHHAGKAGFVVPNGSGGWVTLQEHVATAVAAGTESLVGRVGDLEGRADAHALRLGSVEGRAGTLEGRADSHAQRIGAAEGDISALQTGKASQSAHTALAARVGTLEGRADGQATRIGRAENEINKVITAFNELKVRVGNLDGGSKAPVAPNPIG